MPYSDYRPDLMGSATLTPSGSFEAGSLQSFTLVYTAGAFGVDDTGSIKIGFRFATDFGPVQFTDPKGQGYTTVEASNGATLEAKWEFKRNIRPWNRSLYIGVVKDFLAPGDTITIRFGDRRQGSPGIRVQTYCESQFEFRVFADPDRHLRLRGAAGEPEDCHRAGAGRALARRAADAGAGGRAVPPVDQGRRQVGQSLQPRRSHAAARGGRADRGAAGDAALRAGELRGGGRGPAHRRSGRPRGPRARRERRGAVPDQSAAGRGEGGPARALLGRHARPVERDARHQHGARVLRVRPRQGLPRRHGPPGQRLPDHRRVLARAQRADAEFDKPGRFVCIPGYEWSANTAVGGDRNVHYRHEGETIHRSSHAQIADAADIVDESVGRAHRARSCSRSSGARTAWWWRTSAGATPTSSSRTIPWRPRSRCTRRGARSSGSCAMPSRRTTASASSPTRTGTRAGRAPATPAPRSSAATAGSPASWPSGSTATPSSSRCAGAATTPPPAIAPFSSVTAELASDAEVFLRDPAAGPRAPSARAG